MKPTIETLDSNRYGTVNSIKNLDDDASRMDNQRARSPCLHPRCQATDRLCQQDGRQDRHLVRRKIQRNTKGSQ